MVNLNSKNGALLDCGIRFADEDNREKFFKYCVIGENGKVQ